MRTLARKSWSRIPILGLDLRFPEGSLQEISESINKIS